MSNRYLSIEDILAEEERVPCVFLSHAYRLGHLDPTAGSGHVEEGARLELPLWMAERLAAGQFVGVELPRNFSGSVRDALLAAPKSARLRERSPYFYEAGLRLAGLSHLEEARSLPAAIQATLATRVHMILLRAQHSSERVQASDFLEPLTDLEQRLFWGGYRHQRDLLAWRGLHTWEIRAGGASGSSSSSGGGGSGKAGPGGGDEAAGETARSAMGGAYKRKRAAMG